jgi:undecaprenyl-diphosphatase
MHATLAYVLESDLKLSDRVQSWVPPRWLRLWMLWATRLGDGWVWLLTGLLLLALGGPAHRVLAAAAMSAGLANVVLVVMKRRFRRRRPCHWAPHPAFGQQPISFFPSDRFSFPSGHTTNACAIGWVLSLAFPPLSALLAPLAASIGASRVVMGHHYVSDVLAGAVLGSSIGIGSYLLILG